MADRCGMPCPAEDAVAAFFHSMRSARKRAKANPGAERIAAAMIERYRNSADYLDEQAERAMIERGE